MFSQLLAPYQWALSGGEQELPLAAQLRAAPEPLALESGAPSALPAMSDAVVQYLRDVLSGKIAYEGAMNMPGSTFDPTKTLGENNRMPGSLDRAMGIAMAFGPGSIKAYHGSPHDFTKFSQEKIGTGEGAQAYGHGLYFAENEGVARSYRDALTVPEPKFYAGDRLLSGAEENAARTLLQHNGNIQAAKNFLNSVRRMRTSDESYIDESINALGRLPADSLKEVVTKPTGRMYEVKINANPEDFLQWDKPLSEQGTGVTAALGQLGIKPPQARYSIVPDESGYFRVQYPGENGKQLSSRLFKTRGEAEQALMSTANMQGHNPTGGAIYESSQLVPGDFRDQAMASKVLREAGIPGVRYLDQGSRGAGEGTANYVIFDPDIVEIIRKYGLAGLIAGASAIAAGDNASAEERRN